MVALTSASPFPAASYPLVEDVAWFEAVEPSAAGAARRAAVALAGQLGFDPSRCAEVGVAVTEAMTNLIRHADDGRFLLRALRGMSAQVADGFALQFVAIDSGPGLADVPAAMRDGVTSAGTLGVGLGAIARLSSALDIHSTPGRGTAMVGTFLPDGRSDLARSGLGGNDGSRAFVTSLVAGLTRPITGETACGDAYAVRKAGEGVALLLCDGLGHGELAARAANEAVRIFREAPEPNSPVELLRRIHQGISHTRGAAVAVAVLEPAAGALRLAGVGNISGVILDGSRRSGLISRPGIAGHQARGLMETRHPLSPGSLVILHSDGVTPRFDLSAHPGVASHGALVIAATVLRDAGLRRDDASVLVAVVPRAPAQPWI